MSVTNNMEQSLFVQSRSMNENYCTDPFAVQKIRSHSEAIIFNNLVNNTYSVKACKPLLVENPLSMFDFQAITFNE